MTGPIDRLRRFSRELRRRKVYQVGVAYVVVSAGALQLVDVLVPTTRLPEWSDALLLALAIVFFPVVLILAWMFDATASGVERTGEEAASILAAPEDTPREAGPGPASLAQHQRSSAEPLDPKVVAILPFDGPGAGDDSAAFASGLHDDLLTELSRIRSLTVISRSSVLRYRGTAKGIPRVAAELGAGTVVEGSVRQAAGRVRLNVQLIDARHDRQVWAERYDRELTAGDIFDIQDELARRIVTTLRAELTPEERDRVRPHPTEDLEAFRLYSLGRSLLALRAAAPLREAVEYFERALERDASFAPARAGVATALVLLADYGYEAAEGVVPRAEAEAQRALELDPGLAEAHGALGCLQSLHRRCTRALESHQRAVELQPGYAQGHQWSCWVQLLMGEARAAVASGREAVELDPLEPEARANLSIAWLGAGDPEQALAEADRAVESQDGFEYGLWARALALQHLDQSEEGLRIMERIGQGWAAPWPWTARALGAAGSRGAEAAMPEALNDHLFHQGLIHAANGDPESAFRCFETMHPVGWPETLYLRYHPPRPLGPLRGDPRWPRLIRVLNRSWGVEAGV